MANRGSVGVYGKMLLISAFLSFPAFGGVWQDCTGWFQGAVDKNGDGIFQEGEWLDLRHAALMGSGYKARPRLGYGQIKIESADVDVASLGKTLKDEPCLYLSAPNESNTFDTVELPQSAQATGDKYTVLLRFKRPAELHKYFDASSQTWMDNVRDRIINLGLNWGNKTGIMVSLRPDNNGRPAIAATFGQQADYYTGLYLDWDAAHPPRASHPERDCWHELAIVVNGTKVTFGLLQPGVKGSDNYGKTDQWATLDLEALGLWNNKVTSVVPSAQYRLGNEDKGNTTPFRGWFHMAACWNRALSKTEVKEAFGMPHPSVFRLGCSGCGSDMFAGTAALESFVDARTLEGQVSMPASFAVGNQVSISFSVDDYTKDLEQLLRVLPSSASCAGTFEVKVDNVSVGKLDVMPGSLALLYVPRERLALGSHSLLLQRTDGNVGDVRLDMVELGGSRCFGLKDNDVLPDTSSDASSDVDYWAYDGNLRNLCYTVVPSRGVCLHVDLDETVVANCPLTYRTRMFRSNADAYTVSRELLVNGTRVYADLTTNALVSVRLPAGTLHAGENTFAWRFIDAQGKNIWWQFDYQELITGKPRSGLCLIFR